MTIDTIEKGIKETITHIQGMSKAFIYKDKSVGTFAGKGTYIRLEDIEKILPKDLRSFASNILSQAREEENKKVKVYLKLRIGQCQKPINQSCEYCSALNDVLDYLSTLASERTI